MKIENRQRTLLIAAIGIAALFIGDKVLVTPLTGWWESRAKQIKKLDADVKEGKRYQRRGPALRNQWADMQKNTLPNNSSLASERVLSALQDWAQESGSTLNATTPQWKSDSDDYKTLACRVDASGSLWQLSRFLYDVEKGPMGLRIESVDLASSDNTGQTLKLTLQISGLVLTSQAK